jgi:hypothetical protein
MQHMVETVIAVRPLKRKDVQRLLDDANMRLVAPRVRAERTWIAFRKVPADAAEDDPFLDLHDSIREQTSIVRRLPKDIVCKTLRRLGTNPWQLAEFLNQMGYWFRN